MSKEELIEILKSTHYNKKLWLKGHNNLWVQRTTRKNMLRIYVYLLQRAEEDKYMKEYCFETIYSALKMDKRVFGHAILILCQMEKSFLYMKARRKAEKDKLKLMQCVGVKRRFRSPTLPKEEKNGN